MSEALDHARLPRVRVAAANEAADLDRLAAAGEPVLLPSLVAGWPMVAAAEQGPAALAAYLRARDRGLAVPVMEAPPAQRGRFGYAGDLREFSFTKRSRPLGETLDRILRGIGDPAAPCLAIQMLPLDSHLPDVRRENPLPPVPGDGQPKLWLGGPVRTQIHNDRDHNLACVVAGHRRFLLFPPTAIADLYIGPPDNPPPLSLVDPDAPDLDRFPRFAAALAVAQVAELGPGDALVMPRYWWHGVTSLDPFNAMVNLWWGERPAGLADPAEAFLAALLGFKGLPAGERAYWRAVLDLHVFGDGGADHLPEPARGLLGPLTPGLRARLKAQLKAAVLKW